MKNEWILDVLTDLKSFADSNGLTLLADRLDDARSLAAIELSNLSDADGGDGAPYEGQVGSLSGQLGAGHLPLRVAGLNR